jgi:hypothetical protein
MGVWLTPDPRGYKDSSNLYSFCGGDPVNCTDPRGEGALADTGWSLLGWGAGVLEAAGHTVVGLAVASNPVYQVYKTTSTAIRETKRAVAAYKKGGAKAAAQQLGSDALTGLKETAKGLPIVHTIIEGSKIGDAYAKSPFEGGRQLGKTTFSAAADATLVYGAVEGLADSLSLDFSDLKFELTDAEVMEDLGEGGWSEFKPPAEPAAPPTTSAPPPAPAPPPVAQIPEYARSEYLKPTKKRNAPTHSSVRLPVPIAARQSRRSLNTFVRKRRTGRRADTKTLRLFDRQE